MNHVHETRAPDVWGVIDALQVTVSVNFDMRHEKPSRRVLSYRVDLIRVKPEIKFTN